VFHSVATVTATSVVRAFSKYVRFVRLFRCPRHAKKYGRTRRRLPHATSIQNRLNNVRTHPFGAAELNVRKPPYYSYSSRDIRARSFPNTFADNKRPVNELYVYIYIYGDKKGKPLPRSLLVSSTDNKKRGGIHHVTKMIENSSPATWFYCASADIPIRATRVRIKHNTLYTKYTDDGGLPGTFRLLFYIDTRGRRNITLHEGWCPGVNSGGRSARAVAVVTKRT